MKTKPSTGYFIRRSAVRKSQSIRVSTYVSYESIERKIYLIRHQRVMMDSDLAALYQVPTKVLVQAVKRNLQRFPHDFMFQLTQEEFKILRSQTVTSSWGGRRYPPFAFTEQGVSMLSSVLNSELAIQLNIHIIRTFIRIRELILTHKDLQKQIENMGKKYDRKFQVVFEAIRQLLEPKPNPNKQPIGFHVNSE
jgi:hypothetical protein